MYNYVVYVFDKDDDKNERYQVIYESPVPLQRGDKLRLKNIGKNEGDDIHNKIFRDDLVEIRDIGQDAIKMGKRQIVIEGLESDLMSCELLFAEANFLSSLPFDS